MRQLGMPFRGRVLGRALANQGGAAAPHWATLGGTIDPSHIAAWTPKGAADLAASYTQYGTLPSSFAVGVAPTLPAGGWKFNGSTQYLRTGIIPTDITWSGFVQYTGLVATEFVTVIGAQVSVSQGFLVQLAGPSGTVMSAQQGNIATNATELLSGNYGIAGLTPYRDGVAESTTIAGGGTASNIELYIGAANVGGSPVVFADVTLAALVIYDLTLTAPQAAALKAAMAAL